MLNNKTCSTRISGIVKIRHKKKKNCALVVINRKKVFTTLRTPTIDYFNISDILINDRYNQIVEDVFISNKHSTRKSVSCILSSD